jgi:hypothetical protein
VRGLTEIMIDPNVRVAGNLTFSGFEDVRGEMPALGDYVVVREPEANLVTVGEVRRIDDHDELIYLAIDWKTLVPEHIPSLEEFTQLLSPRFTVTSTTTATVGASGPKFFTEADLLISA